MSQPLLNDGVAVADVAFLPSSSFTLGSLSGIVRTDDPEFRTRFEQGFHDCLHPGGTDAGASAVVLEVRAASGAGPVVLRLSGHETALPGPPMESLFPDLSLVRVAGVAGWRAWARRENPRDAVLATRDDLLLIDRSLPWQVLTTHYFIHHLMRLQPEWLFIHGATLAIGGSGVLLAGDKGAGKSTLSLALAARGHGFLGDEIAGIRKDGGEVAPFRRAASIRRGPQSARVVDYLERAKPGRIVTSDGTDRVRLPVSCIFPGARPRSVRLTHAFFLEGEAQRPYAERFDFVMRDVYRLSPMHGTLRGESGGGILAMLNSFRPVLCYSLARGGTPDETAELIEQIVEGTWDTACRKEPSASARFAGSRSS